MPARKKPRPEPVDAELVPDPAPESPLPPEMPSYGDAAQPPSGEIEQAPTKTWEPLPLGKQINTETMRQIQEAFPPSRVVDMMEKMAGAMIEGKSGILREDHRTREQLIKILLSYNLGLPVPQQQVIEPPPKESNEQTMERLLRSPAARRALREAVAKAEAEAEAVTAEKDGNEG